MIVVGYLLGTLVTGLLCWRAIRSLTIDRDAAQLAARDLGLELLGAFSDIDKLSHELGQAPPSRPQISDLSRTARSQESPCSSNRSSAG